MPAASAAQSDGLEGNASRNISARHISKKRKLAGSKGSPKDGKRERRKSSLTTEDRSKVLMGESEPAAANLSSVIKNAKDSQKRDRKQKKKQNESVVPWTVSAGTGGRFLTLEPIFAGGEQCVLPQTLRGPNLELTTLDTYFWH